MIRAFLVGLVIILGSLSSLAQVENDSTVAQAPKSQFQKERVVEIFKVNGRKKFRLKHGRKVWVRLFDPDGNAYIKKARIVNISEHEITFRPFDPDFKEVVYSDSTLKYIGFTSAGRVIIALITDTIMVGVTVVGVAAIIGAIVIEVVFVPIFLITGQIDSFSFKWAGDSFKELGRWMKSIVPLKKKIVIDGETFGVRIRAR